MKKSKFKVNIDTVEFNVTGMKFHIPGSTTATVKSAKGELIKQYQNRAAIRNKQDTHSVNVRTENRNTLMIEGSPFAFFYGQNLFTSANLYKGCFRTLVRVCNHFGFKPPKDLQEAWRTGDINLTRVDLAVDFKLEGDDLVIETLKQIKRQLVEKATTMKTNKTSVSWSPRDGVEFSITFYAKGPQMKQQKRYKNSTYREALEHESEGTLRMELRLRHNELRKLCLEKVSEWTMDTPNDIVQMYFNDLNFLNVTCGALSNKELANVESKLRPVLALHKSGIDLNQVYEKRTLQRHQARFRAKGIDIKCPNRPKESVVISLPELLSHEKSIKSSPKWMRVAKLVPTVKAKKAKA